MVGRRSVLMGIGAGALGAALGAGLPIPVLAKEKSDTEDSELMGVWTVTFENIATHLSDHALVVFTSGGALLNVQTDFPTAGLGAWARTDESKFTFTLIQWDYRDGLPPGRVVLHGSGQVEDSLLSGTYTSEVTRGGVVTERASFVYTGTRTTPA